MPNPFDHMTRYLQEQDAQRQGRPQMLGPNPSPGIPAGSTGLTHRTGRAGAGGMARYFMPAPPRPTVENGGYRPNTGQPPPQQRPAAPAPAPAPSVPPEQIIDLWRRTLMPREAPPPLPDRIQPIAPIDDSEAWRATYGRAKETAGNQSRRALDALMEMQGARGILGGGLGISEIGSNVIGPALNQLGDVNRQLAEQSYAAEVDRQRTNYQGGINQRSQDISHHGNVYQGGIQQRGQDQSLLPIIRALYNVSY